MGGIFSIRMHAEQDSIFEPGQKSAVSDPISKDLVDDMHEFWSEFIEVAKDPVNYDLVHEQYFVKQFEVDAKDPDDYTCKVYFDGRKLKKLLPDKDFEESILRYHFNLKIDRKNLHTISTDYKVDEPETGSVNFELHSVFHKLADGAFRVEVWSMNKEGERQAGPWVSGMVEWLWVKPLLASRLEAKVRVKSSVEVPDSGGESVMTEPLDEYFTAEGFLDSMGKFMKETVLDIQGEIHYVSDCEWRGQGGFEMPKDPMNPTGGTSKVEWSRMVNSDPQNLTLCVTDRINDELMNTSFYRMHQDPVRCEFWQILPCGVRRGGGKQATKIRFELMKLISERAVKEQIEGIQGDTNFIL